MVRVASQRGIARPATMRSSAEPSFTLRAANHPSARKTAYIAPTTVRAIAHQHTRNG